MRGEASERTPFSKTSSEFGFPQPLWQILARWFRISRQISENRFCWPYWRLNLRACQHLSSFFIASYSGRILVPLDINNNNQKIFFQKLWVLFSSSKGKRVSVIENTLEMTFFPLDGRNVYIISYITGCILYGSKIQNMKIISNWVLRDAKWWEDSKPGLKIQIK